MFPVTLVMTVVFIELLCTYLTPSSPYPSHSFLVGLYTAPLHKTLSSIALPLSFRSEVDTFPSHLARSHTPPRVPGLLFVTSLLFVLLAFLLMMALGSLSLSLHLLGCLCVW